MGAHHEWKRPSAATPGRQVRAGFRVRSHVAEAEFSVGRPDERLYLHLPAEGCCLRGNQAGSALNGYITTNTGRPKIRISRSMSSASGECSSINCAVKWLSTASLLPPLLHSRMAAPCLLPDDAQNCPCVICSVRNLCTQTQRHLGVCRAIGGHQDPQAGYFVLRSASGGWARSGWTPRTSPGCGCWPSPTPQSRARPARSGGRQWPGG